MALNFPDNPGIGSVFVDTNSGFSYKWDGTVWNGFAGSSASEISNLDDISGSFDGIETTFALTKNSVSVSPVKAEQLRVVLGGVTQTALTDYTINGSNIIFTTAPIGSLTCTITQLGVALSIAVPGDGVVTPAKLSTGGPSWNTSGDLYISGIATANNGLVVGAGLTLADDVKINLGDDSDLQIVHDGSNSLIDGAGTGGIHLRSDTEIKFLKRTGSENILVGAADGSVAAFYDNTKRLETTDGGALVYGTVGAGQTALVVEGDIKATGIVTAVSFNGDLVGTAATTNSTGLHVVGVATISNINSTNVTAGVVTATTFDGTLSGNATSATTATTATNVTVADESTDTSCNVLFTTAATGDLAPKSGTNLTFDSSTGALTATSFVGNLSGNATGLSGTPNIDCGTGSFTGDVDIADKIVHTGDTNTAIRFPATDTITFETSGSERIRVDNAGNVGIGTAAPGQKLVVSAGGAQGLEFNPFSATAFILAGYNRSTSAYIDLDYQGNNHIFRNGTTERMRIDSSGNVGIGSDIPSAKLDVNGSATFGGDIQVTGVVTATSFSGDGSTLTGVESGVADFVATGTIPNGSTVIVNADGTVSVPVQTSLSTPIAGDSEIFEFANTWYPSAAFDPINQKVVVAYRDDGNSSYGTAIVGTVSGNTITFGAPVVFESNFSEHFSTVYDSANQKIVIAYRTSVGTQARAIVGTVTGDTITFGTFTGFASSSTSISATYDSTNQKVVIAYRDSGNLNYGTAIVGTVSGTSISFGTSTVFESANSGYISATYDSTNGKVVVAYSDLGNSNYGTAVVGTVSGTSISFGTPVIFNNSGTTEDVEATYDSTNQKVVIAYRDIANSSYGTAIVGTVSGTSISFGTPVVFLSNSIGSIFSTYDSINGKVTIVYQDVGNSNYGTAILGTVSGTSISFGTPVVFESASTQYFSATYDPNINRVVVAYRNNGNNSWGTAVVLANSSTTLTEDNYIGIAAEAISNGVTGKINIIGGINNGQSGLTVARKYYTDTTGGIGLTPSNPSVVAGVSISPTEIIVKGTTSNDSSSSSTYISDGDWNLISTITASNAATASFTSGIDSTYDTYAIIGTNLQPTGTANRQLYMRFSTDGGSSYIASSAYGQVFGNTSSSTSTSILPTQLRVTGNISGSANSTNTATRGAFKMFFNNFSSSEHKTGYGEASSTFINGSANWIDYSNYGFAAILSSINAIQFYFESTNISTGTFRLYGINNS